MKFGVISPGKTTSVIEKANLAEEVGFDLYGLSDTQLLVQETYATMGVVAHETDSILVGPTVTNPITRHPTVTASAIGTIHQHTQQAFLGIATGDSAVYTLDKRPAKLAELEEAVRLIRCLWQGESCEYEGNSLKLQWLESERFGDEQQQSYDIPIGMTAEGLKTLQTAGRVADKVFIGLGGLPEVIDSASSAIDRGIAEEGRDQTDVEKWVYMHVNVSTDDSYDELVEEMLPGLASIAHHSLQFTFEGKEVPDQYADEIKRFVKAYDSDDHGQEGNPALEILRENAELTEYLADRYGIIGTPDDAIQKINSIRATDEIDGILTLQHGDSHDAIQLFGEDVISEV